MQQEPVAAEQEPTFGSTVTILFSDLRGFTDFTNAHGDAAAYRVVRVYNTLIEEQVALHGGHIVKTQGDSWMVSFDSARRALNCAIAMQAATTHATALDGDIGLKTGIGINSGEPVYDDGDFFGSTVNLAARICAAAAPGQILVSETVRQLVGKLDQAPFVDRGLLRVKGFPQPQHVFEVDWMGLAPADAAPEPVQPSVNPAPVAPPAPVTPPAPTTRRSPWRALVILGAAIVVVALAVAGYFFGAYGFVSHLRAPAPLVADNFSDPGSGLFPNNQQGPIPLTQSQLRWTYAYQNGSLIGDILGTFPTGQTRALGMQTEARADFTQDIAAEVTAAATRSPDQAAYALEYTIPGGNTYRFVVTPAIQQYGLNLASSGAIQVVTLGRSTAIQSGSAANQLRFEIRGSTMRLLVNGTTVDVAQDDRISARPARVGLRISMTGPSPDNAVEVRFTNFAVYSNQ